MGILLKEKFNVKNEKTSKNFISLHFKEKTNQVRTSTSLIKQN